MESKFGFLTMKKALTLADEQGRKLVQLGGPVTLRCWEQNVSVNFFPYKKRNPKKRKFEEKCIVWTFPLDQLLEMRKDGININDAVQLCAEREKPFEYLVAETENGRTFYEFKIGRDIYRRDIDTKPVTVMDLPQMERDGIVFFVPDGKGNLVEL